MTIIKVSIKWGQNKYDDVELNTDESPAVFAAQVFALTNVLPERQKLMIKGAIVKADSDWNKLKVKDGSAFTLMGSVGDLPDAPKEKVVFLEDMNEAEQAGVAALPPGLVNLGNTCYMNATVQALRTAPELVNALQQFDAPPTSTAHRLAKDLSTLYSAVASSKSTDVVDRSVAKFLTTLRQHNPRFAEQREGHFAQQDASECWSEVMRALKESLPLRQGLNPLSPGESFIDRYFGLTEKVTMKCLESDAEPATESTESQLQLSCHIEKEVAHMWSGIKNAMEEKIIKASPTLGRDAEYKRTVQLSRLPGYLVVNFVRFYFKRSTNEKCKITRDVKFSFTLDAYELCTPDLQERLRPRRDKFKEYADWSIEQETTGAAMAKKSKTEAPEYENYSFEEDPGSNSSGYYELQAVLTHRGRSSDSGHYVCWSRIDEDKWLLYDDDQVSIRKREDVEKLSGGADWHTAYILIYGPKRLPKMPPGARASSAAAAAANTDAMST